MAIEKKESFIKQIAIYLKEENYQKAYETSKEFSGRFPSEMISHYLLAKAAFWIGKYDEAAEHGRKAFNMASGDDLVPCAIITASAYYQLGKYSKGYEMLGHVKTEEKADLEKLKFAFAVAMEKEEDAVAIFEVLLSINRKEAEKLLERFLAG